MYRSSLFFKKRDEWKIVFTTLKGLFEPTVIFFRLTNSLTTFQIIMNEILWNLINTREVASFIDNVIVKIEEEKEHDKVVEEVVRRLTENDLYVKLEKKKMKKILE